MANGWGGKRPGSGRKSYPQIKKCRDSLEQARYELAASRPDPPASST